MFICFAKLSSVVNLIHSEQECFSFSFIVQTPRVGIHLTNSVVHEIIILVGVSIDQK
jgi:hypothetical protein